LRKRFILALSLMVALASVSLITMVNADGTILTLSVDEMFNNFAYEWGPGTLVSMSAYTGGGVLFQFSGLDPSSSTGVGDNFPVGAEAGGAYKDYGNGFAGPYDFSGYTKYQMYVANLGDSDVKVCLKMNTGWTDSPWGSPERDTYWQSEWVTVPPGYTVLVVLDFSCCGAVYNAEDDPNPEYQYPDGTSGVPVHRLDEVSQIGFQILGDGDATIVLSSQPPEGFQVIPVLPLGTILASAIMIIAVAAYVTLPRWRKKTPI